MDISYNNKEKKENQIKSQRNKYDCKVGKGQAYTGKKASSKIIKIRFNKLKK